MTGLMDSLHLVPRELKARPQWVLWRSERRGDRDTKVPYAVDGRRASSTDPATWATFDAATRAYEDAGGTYSGIGYVFAADDPYCGIDLDDAIDADGETKDWAARIIGRLDSYTETSPSGTGVKVWLKGKLPGERHRAPYADGEIEMYEAGRYFTVTGMRHCGVSGDLEERQPQLDALYAEVFPAAAPKPPMSATQVDVFDAERVGDNDGDQPTADPVADRTVTVTPMLGGWEAAQQPSLTDDQIIERARRAKNGDKFERLWAGDTGEYGNDDSRADIALCSILAFWTHGDPAAVDRLFRRSGLYRRKWERGDYRDRTIGKAIEGRNEGRDAAAAAAAEQAMPAGAASPDCLPPTDLGNARRLTHYHGDDIRYVPGIGWYYWTGSVWELDVTGEVMRRAKMVAELIPHEFAPCRRKSKEREVLKWAISSQSHAKLTAMLGSAESEPGIAVRPEQLDAHPFLLAVGNGTLDLRSGRLLPHRRADLLTKASPVAFDPAATCPVFNAFLDRIFAGNRPLIEYVLAVLGHCLTGDISLEHLWVFYGSGANGKSTLLGVVQYIMGGHAGTAPDSLLCASKRDEHPTELADLQGRRLVIASETESNASLKLQLLKRLTGEPTIKARRMRQDFYEFGRTHKMILMTNNKPRVREDTEAVWRRLRLIPFTVEIPAAERDPQLAAKLRAEASGILNRLVDGCLRWQRDGLIEPPEVRAATNEYRAESDPLGDFLDERCASDPQGWVSTAALYAAYLDYCKVNGETYLGRREFGGRLGKRGDCSPKKHKGERGWSGFKLRDAEPVWAADADDGAGKKNGWL